MNNLPNFTTTQYSLDKIFSMIEEGNIKIPQFQRDFVWDKVKAARLLDSVLKGYPIGNLILWKTKDRLRSLRNIGNINLPEPKEGDYIYYVLDGQQRLTSLFAIKKGAIVAKENQKSIDYKDIYLNLSLPPDTDEDIVTMEKNYEFDCITIYEILNSKISSFLDKYGKDKVDKIETYRNKINNYSIPIVELTDCPLDIACTIFTRINTGGTVLTLFEIMVAKTYDETRNFDLSKEYERLINSNGECKDLEDSNYDTIPESVVLQCIAAYIKNKVSKREILKLNKNDVIESWNIVKERGIFPAVDFLRNSIKVPVSSLMPYYSLLVPFSYFFIKNYEKNGSETTSNIQTKLLTQYFYWASLTNRFTSGVPAKIEQDLLKMDKIVNNEPPDYPEEELKISFEDLIEKRFSTSEAYCKALLCVYAANNPLNLRNNSSIRLDNSWLRRANSRNYHHFFPRAYLRRKGINDDKANVILNIILVDDYLNKRVIGAKPPSKYIREFMRENDDIEKALRSHFINDAEKFGIFNNDYEAFIQERAKVVSRRLRSLLRPKI